MGKNQRSRAYTPPSSKSYIATRAAKGDVWAQQAQQVSRGGGGAPSQPSASSAQISQPHQQTSQQVVAHNIPGVREGAIITQVTTFTPSRGVSQGASADRAIASWKSSATQPGVIAAVRDIQSGNLQGNAPGKIAPGVIEKQKAAGVYVGTTGGTSTGKVTGISGNLFDLGGSMLAGTNVRTLKSEAPSEAIGLQTNLRQEDYIKSDSGSFFKNMFSGPKQKSSGGTISPDFTIKEPIINKGYTTNDIFKGISVSYGAEAKYGFTSARESQLLESGTSTIFGYKIPTNFGKLMIGQVQAAREVRLAKEEYNIASKKQQETIDWQAALSSKPGLISTTNYDKKTKSYSIEYSPNVNIEKMQTGLMGKGINMGFDKTINTITNQISPTETQTTTSTTYSNIKFGDVKVGGLEIKYPTQTLFESKAMEGKMSKTRASILSIGTPMAEYTAKGAVIYAGGELLGVGAGLNYLSTTLPRATSIGSKLITAGMIGFSAADIGYSSYKGYTTAESRGVTPTFGALTMGGRKAGQVIGFFIGASGGALSPLGPEAIVVDKATGNIKVLSIGLRNPFGRQGFALGTYEEGAGLKLGSFNPLKSKIVMGELESGGPMGVQLLRKLTPKTVKIEGLGMSLTTEEAKQALNIGEKTARLINKLQSPGKSIVDITETKGIQSMSKYPELQKEVTNFFTNLGKGSGKFSFGGLGTAMKEASFGGYFSSAETVGLERGFGSTFTKAEKGISRQPGDIDFNVYGKVTPKVQTFVSGVKAKNIPGSQFLTAEEGKLSFQGIKIGEGFGKDTPQMLASPFGYKGQAPKSMLLSTGGDIAGQKLGETGVQRWSSLLTIKWKGGKMTMGPREGQEKALGDIYKILGRSSELTSGKKSASLISYQEQYGILAKQINPNLNLKTGTIDMTTTATAKPISLTLPSTGSVMSKSSSSSISSLNVRPIQISSSLSSMSSSSSRSISISLPSSIKSSRSSMSSLSSSSKSSLSSISSLSSLSKSSISSRSSLSSLSSLSSMSSDSSSSSSSSGSSMFSITSIPSSSLSIPSLDLFGERRGTQVGRRKYKYTPSLVSVYTKLGKGLRMPRTMKGGSFTGLELRPMKM